MSNNMEIEDAVDKLEDSEYSSEDDIPLSSWKQKYNLSVSPKRQKNQTCQSLRRTHNKTLCVGMLAN